MKTIRMKSAETLLGSICLVATAAGAQTPDPLPLRGLREVGPEHVVVYGGFWGPRLKTAQDVTVPHALDELEKDGHVTNFDKAAGKFDGPLKEGAMTVWISQSNK